MHLRRTAAACIGIALISTACQPAAEIGGSLSDEDAAAIRTFFAQHTENALASDWEADAALYAEDAVRLPPNAEVIRGRAAIQAGLAQIDTVLDYTAEIIELDGRGDLAYLWVAYSYTGVLQGSDDAFLDVGKALVILKKQQNGSWMFSRVMWNANEPV